MGEENKDIDNNIDANIKDDASKSDSDTKETIDAGDESAKKSDAKAEDQGDKSEDKQTEDFKDDGEDPLPRHEINRRYAQVRIAKKEAKSKESKDKNEDNNANDYDNIDSDDISDEDYDLTPEDEKNIEKYLKKIGIIDKLAEVDQQKETSLLKEFFSDKENDIFLPFKDKIERFSKNPLRQNIPLKAMAWEVAGPHLLKLGAQKQKEADKKAKENGSGGGSQASSTTTKKKVEDMTDKEFSEYLLEIQQRPRD